MEAKRQGNKGRAAQEQGEAPAQASPRMKFAVRGNNGIEFFWVDDTQITRDETFSSSTGQDIQFSADGSLFAVVNATSIGIYKSSTNESLATIEEAGVVHVAFSPQNLFLLTAKRWSKEQQSASNGNISIWDVKNGSRLHNFVQKKLLWPAIQWSGDQSISAKVVSSEVQFFVGQNWDNVVKAIKLPGVEDFSFAPGISPPTVVVFVPEKQGGPGYARIYKYPKVGEVVSSRTLWKAQNVEFFWNSKGSAVLVMTHTSVDRTGKSYYGQTGLQFLSTDSSLDCNISLDAEGPVHDAKWSPDGSQFVVIYGYMPAQATLFDEKCRKLADFGSAPRNTVRWSPCGRLVALAGFGNLNGQVDVWDVKRVRKVGSYVVDCGCSIEWSPDSQLLLTAALSPKIRVDNGYTLWKYDGTRCHHSAYPILYEAKWQPAATSLFPLRRIKTMPQGKLAAQSPTAPAKPAIYQPPSMRGQTPVLTREDTESQKPRKYRTDDKAGQKERTVNVPVGAAPESKAALRNKQRRQRRKQKDQTETADEQPQVAAETKQADPQKQIRAIQKKLRQIEQLKEKEAAGQPLDPSQLNKIASADALERELAVLMANNKT